MTQALQAAIYTECTERDLPLPDDGAADRLTMLVELLKESAEAYQRDGGNIHDIGIHNGRSDYIPNIEREARGRCQPRISSPADTRLLPADGSEHCGRTQHY